MISIAQSRRASSMRLQEIAYLLIPHSRFSPSQSIVDFQILGSCHWSECMKARQNCMKMDVENKNVMETKVWCGGTTSDEITHRSLSRTYHTSLAVKKGGTAKWVESKRMRNIKSRHSTSMDRRHKRWCLWLEGKAWIFESPDGDAFPSKKIGTTLNMFRKVINIYLCSHFCGVTANAKWKSWIRRRKRVIARLLWRIRLTIAVDNCSWLW